MSGTLLGFSAQLDPKMIRDNGMGPAKSLRWGGAVQKVEGSVTSRVRSWTPGLCLKPVIVVAQCSVTKLHPGPSYLSHRKH
jgi:hypothetical protein